MAELSRNFTAGKMNKVIDERLVPNGEYIDAMNIRMGSTELSEIGVIENTKGNDQLAALKYIDGTPLSSKARCIGSYADGTNETIYWFVHDPEFPVGPTGKLDLIVSFNVYTEILTYHVISINDGSNAFTTLNFNPTYLITGINLIGDLLFFTDDYNAPRCINVLKNYPNPVANVDYGGSPDILKEAILVIKKPPVESPAISPFVTPGQENFMEDRFICFAYRYKYEDGQYSATSQFSAPSFIPKGFDFSNESFLNEGMINSTNACTVTYNSGGPLVKEVDLLFKEASGNIIRVIEKLNKQELGLVDNTDYTYDFSNNKIYTILPEAELLRLYDNVPRYAKAQTIMGNRLMYGNYVEGYDLITIDGSLTKLIYTTELISENIKLSDVDTELADFTYTVDSSVFITDSSLVVDLTGKELKEGAILNIELTFAHSAFSGVAPAEESDNFSVNFSFRLPQDYGSVFQMVTSTAFQEAVGTISNIKPVYSPDPLVETSCEGITFTDEFNCIIPYSLGTYTKVQSSINNPSYQQPINAYGSLSVGSQNNIYFQFPAMKFLSPDPDCTVGCSVAWEYYKIINVNATYQLLGDTRSLHSNRDYEIGIVYMDEFNRSTTALVSPNNTVHIPCGDSQYKNSIKVTIPVDQKAPAWATRYKFVIKPDQENYETIYSDIYFNDIESNSTFFLLEGENARKVQTGDRFIVKADADGPLTKCAYATVLDKQVYASGPSSSSVLPDLPTYQPAGVYMKINANSFSTATQTGTIIAPGEVDTRENTAGDYPINYYPCNIEDPENPGSYIDYTIPQGSKIHYKFKIERRGKNCDCEQRLSTLDVVLTASKDYDNFYDWWEGDNVADVLNSGTNTAGCGDPAPTNVYQGITNTAGDISTAATTNYFKFYRNSVTEQLQLMTTGTVRCDGAAWKALRMSRVTVNIEVYRAENKIIFETEPSDALPDVWFENDESYPIIDNQYHGAGGHGIDQDATTAGEVLTGFFNCFTFGNGAESYKIRDSITGRSFNLGNRVTSVSAQDYKEADRFADITYSGIYNAETNVNNLNVFNLGLQNFKNLETSFGNIYILDGRETDVLTLQEDKISYVLAGKNLLSDSTGGGAIATVPEVLGTQIARVEKYGISFNPESYVQWGYDRYFTDAKRGVVLQMRGNSYSSDQLQVISEFGMRTWFRDLFNTSFNTQKLGGYDPYMNEYVLSSNDIQTPEIVQCVDCGITRTFTVTAGSSIEYCVDLSQIVGDVEVTYTVLQNIEGGSFEISATYNGDTVTSGPTNESGTLNIDKDSQTVTTVSISTTSDELLTLQVTVNCPVPQYTTIVEIVLTNNSEAGDTIHTEYKYTNGAFVSPTQSNLVTFISGFDNPLASRYNTITGVIGTGAFPPAGSTMTLATNKISSDTFVFDPLNDRFRYYTSNTFYDNNSVDLNTLIGLSTVITPNQGGGNYNYAEFTVPALDDYLYIIWDFRDAIPAQLCYDSMDLNEVCCNCTIIE